MSFQSDLFRSRRKSSAHLKHFNPVYGDSVLHRNYQAASSVNDLRFNQIGVFRVNGDFYLRGRHLEFLGFHHINRIQGCGFAEFPTTGLVECTDLFRRDAASL